MFFMSQYPEKKIEFGHTVCFNVSDTQLETWFEKVDGTRL